MKASDLKNFFSLEKRTEYFVHVLVYLFALSVIVFAFLVSGNKNPERKAATRQKTYPFQNISLEGKGIIVYDLINDRELYSKSPDLPLPLASLTKVMTVIVSEQKIRDDENIQITEDYLSPEGDSKLLVGDSWKAENLRDFTLLTSSNDGAFALAAISEGGSLEPQYNKSKFVKEMNDEAESIGLVNSKFFNEHGLDREGDKGGAYGSARDMATLFEYALKNYPEVLEVTRYKSVEFSSGEKTYSAENTNTFVDKIPNLIASKTGYTDLAGGNLVIVFDAGLNRPIIISVLGSTENGRFEDALKLVNATMQFITNGG